jgi:nitroimidazol reductase NimA-like FMN-containing flavoprotein (pyridoxamine 5'-phosphate oxidase superfamily)
MTQPLSREETLNEAVAVAAGQAGGTLATTHAEDGTPYVTFVLFHLRENGEVLFGSGTRPQHTRNILATPEVSFLIDNREVIRGDWTSFNRVVIEGRAAEVDKAEAEYERLLAELSAKNKMAGVFTDRGMLFRVTPRRLILMKGFEPMRHTLEFADEA